MLSADEIRTESYRKRCFYYLCAEYGRNQSGSAEIKYSGTGLVVSRYSLRLRISAIIIEDHYAPVIRPLAHRG
jgi:hypothetical protein